MRNVDRLDEPEVLRRKARGWTEELLRAIADASRTNRKVPLKLWSRYNNKEVRERLKMMFSGLCCYCESRIGDVANENIEHRKPKALFPDLTFGWANLYLACPRCNQAKADKWDSVNEILDAVTDNPISNHLGYKLTGAGVRHDPVTNRGAVTIDHADLDREDLLQSLQEVFNEAVKTVLLVRDKERYQVDAPMVRIAKKELRQRFSSEHGTLIEFVANRVLNTV
jgi:uncharacterized protein (TIGR02646 family)